jgi:hypothetical protein
LKERAVIPLSAKDRMVIVLLLVFTAIALTLELYWIIFNQEMESRTDLLARAIAVFWPADRTFRIPGYPVEKAFTLALEMGNTLITPWLAAVLIYSIVYRKPYRYPLQLVVAAYTSYGTILYFVVAHISGYVIFQQKSVGTYLLFYLVNMPWLIAYSWMGWDAYQALVRRERA